MNKPTEEQIQEVLAGTSTPETARLVAQWFATDEGTAYLSRSMDCEVEQVKLILWYLKIRTALSSLI